MAVPAADGDSALPQHKEQPKALRFVTNYGAPQPKRRRIGAACLTCRKRKTACSGERPFCETCKQTKQDCVGYSADTAPPTLSHRRTFSDVGIRKGANTGTKSRSGSVNWPLTAGFAKRDPVTFEQFPFKNLSRHDVRTARTQQLPPTPDAHSKLSAAQYPLRTEDGGAGSLDSSRRSDPRQPVRLHVDDSRGRDGTQRAAERNVQPLFARPRNRMPYFRWLGPTAIMPGFKQMVVKVKRQETAELRGSSIDGGGTLSPMLNTFPGDHSSRLLYPDTPATIESDVRTPLNLPFYDTSPISPNELITHLADTFFSHLGCNYPFLQRERFLRDLEEKQVDAILVDAVCALAARFSTHPLLMHQPHDEAKASPAEYGHAFAQRAKTALVDTFPCPSVAAVQAALLLAYNEFGESRDSGLWMYLGISIRMAQDLGMHKLEGLRFRGISGPTPKMVKRDSIGSATSVSPIANAFAESTERGVRLEHPQQSDKEIDEQKAVEQERVDTFWAIFFLDRVVSSGTGRRSTLRDKDIELSFPDLDELVPASGWPAVFPALIRIVHLYGRVADILNSVKEPADITVETPNRLAATESQVTQFYQGLSPRLHFDAVNFQHYMKAGQGTNFVLLHFWFHTMIVLLHQPTLLKTFEGGMLQLFPNSQQLSLSSAKTIADILSYSQLMDAKASLGNPFTSQPIYIAACAFLKETAEQTATSNAHSRASSPSRKMDSLARGLHTSGQLQSSNKTSGSSSSSVNGKTTPIDHKALAKHTLLATAASQHYQLCYKALQSLETYWAGTKYILTVLDQKFEGVGDPLLYTVEEGESSMERPRPEPAFTSPGWRRKQSLGPCLTGNPFLKAHGLSKVPGSPGVDPSKAIGWTLTGTMNSPNTNLARHYASGGAKEALPRQDVSASLANFDAAATRSNGQYSGGLRPELADRLPMSAPEHFARPALPSMQPQQSNVSTADANLLLGLGSPYTSNLVTPAGTSLAFGQNASVPVGGPGLLAHQPFDMPYGLYPSNGYTQNFGDMMIESQDVDMSMLGLDMNMPWFDAFPTPDMVSSFFDSGDAHGGAASHQRAPS
ncbi:hypothetical protein B0A54_13636 [Friedmanniomyces endolithicus]|uniref:Zn(2)-C6 fungal-type domain-containing protein n=1 Tax=Friedmanniomyces endolithicus TaxID=329885 RepID=A0A4U0UG55_9PEZI|nr:hypothetical protein LTS09_010452 [Friedmanniomyces endolithicus]TKA34580.1 hypothetical protein B0A54_13636 [Friedmanniomyces endolithicus]